MVCNYKLPGRTDNEIKNYWNTRIKRCQRSGLPLYPPPENHQPLDSSGSSLPCHDMSCNNDVSPSLLKSKGFSSAQLYSYTMQILKAKDVLVQGPDDPLVLGTQSGCDFNHLSQLFGMSDLNHCGKLFSVNQDTHFVSNLVPSSSEHLKSVQKLELPSLQYQETSSGFWDLKSKPSDAAIQSPVSGDLSTHRRFRGSSGLLEDLIYEAKAVSKPHPGDIDPTSLTDESMGSNSNVYTPASPFDCSSEDILEKQLKSEMVSDEMRTFLDCLENSTPESWWGS